MTTEQEIAYIIRLHYSNNKACIRAWYNSYHGLLGAIPVELIRQKKAFKVLEFLKRVKS